MTTPNRFRFRAWDYTHNRMNYNVLPYIAKGINNVIAATIIDGDLEKIGLYLEPNHSKVMQSTGLTDKNGKEIFEGDILRILCNKKMARKHGDFESTAIAKVDWADDRAAFICTYISYSDTEEWHGHAISSRLDGQWLADNKYERELEIIGSIYENPELLNS